jgi:hypothetical protein
MQGYSSFWFSRLLSNAFWTRSRWCPRARIDICLYFQESRLVHTWPALQVDCYSSESSRPWNLIWLRSCCATTFSRPFETKEMLDHGGIIVTSMVRQPGLILERGEGGGGTRAFFRQSGVLPDWIEWTDQLYQQRYPYLCLFVPDHGYNHGGIIETYLHGTTAFKTSF